MKIFDDLLESFSAKDLKSRVHLVIISGAVLILIAAAGASWLLLSMQRITILGSGQWAKGASQVLNVSVGVGDIERLSGHSQVTIELLDPKNGWIRLKVPILAIDPATSIVQINTSGFPQQLRNASRIDIRFLLLEKPYWQLLLSK